MLDANDGEPSPPNEAEIQGRRAITREELYTLLWQTPLTKLAKRFGLSDVGLRKICTKHTIPTPQAGHWAKVAHGKRVHQPPLPPSSGKGKIVLADRRGPPAPATVAAAQDTALADELSRPAITVPAERPARLHPLAAATARALRTAKTDQEGFKQTSADNAVNVTIGRESIDRVLRIIDTLAHAARERGHVFAEHSSGVRIVVDDVPMSWRLYEIKDRVPHQPTREELKEQARLEANRARWPQLYSSRSDRKAYRSWDYAPSGRLAMTFTETASRRWGRDRLIGHWCDRKVKRLEDYLGDAMAALATGAITVKHRLAEEAEEVRRRAEALERRRRAQAKRERAMKRHDYLLGKAEDFARYERLARFATFMEREVYRYRHEPVDNLIDELKAVVRVMGQGFAREGLQEEIDRLQLYGDDDVDGESNATTW